MNLRVGGLIPLSTTDYPDHLAAVVFCQGCPWRCGYCHNPHLLPHDGRDEIPWDDVATFLGRRQGLLDAVVFSGGEPTLHAGLPDAMRAVKTMGYKVGLHTAGIYPRRLEAVLPLVDWVGMDVKAPFHRYGGITGASGSGARARQSIQIIVASGVACEFRTTVHRELLSRDDLAGLAPALAALGVRRYVLQEFRASGCPSPHLVGTTGSHFDSSLGHELERNFDTLVVRRAAAA